MNPPRMAEVERVLDQIARELLDGDAAGTPTGADDGPDAAGTNRSAPLIEIQARPVIEADSQRCAEAA